MKNSKPNLTLVPPTGLATSNKILTHLDCLTWRELHDGRNAIRTTRADLHDLIETVTAEIEDLPAELTAPLSYLEVALHDLRSDLGAALSEVDEEMNHRPEAE